MQIKGYYAIIIIQNLYSAQVQAGLSQGDSSSQVTDVGTSRKLSTVANSQSENS